jgi:hypothetical protein
MNWYYYDNNGTKQGLISQQELENLVARGAITRTTRLETEGGHKGLAGQIPGLFDGNPAVIVNVEASLSRMALFGVVCAVMPLLSALLYQWVVPLVSQLSIDNEWSPTGVRFLYQIGILFGLINSAAGIVFIVMLIRVLKHINRNR